MSTSEHDRLQNDLFDSSHQQAQDEQNMSDDDDDDDDDDSSVESLDYKRNLSPPGKRRKLRAL